MSEVELQDAILRHALDLQRLSAHEEAEALAILRELEADLRRLMAARQLTGAPKREIEALIAQAQEAVSGRYTAIAGTVDTQGIIALVADRTVEAMRLAIPQAIRPTAERLASLASNVLIDGAPSRAWWRKQSSDTAFRFAAQVRQGIINGETQERIVGRIVGRAGEPGVLDVSRRAARALVHSSVMSAANAARLETYRKNGKHVAGLRWLSTLDSHTCVVCAALDGQRWDLEGKKLRGTEIDFQAPPAHFACRCVLSPIPKSLDDIFGRTGLDELTESLSRRASSEGPVAGSTTFAQFLRRQSAEFVENTLGKRRAEMFLAGRLTLRDLVSGTGRPLTLDELRR